MKCPAICLAGSPFRLYPVPVFGSQSHWLRLSVAIFLAVSIFATQRSVAADFSCVGEADDVCSVEFYRPVQKDKDKENSSKVPEKHCSCPCHHATSPVALCLSFDVLIPLSIANHWEMVPGTVLTGLTPGCLERPPRN